MMVGLGVGDALGCPVEGLTWLEIRQRFGELKDFRDSFTVEEARTMAARLTKRDRDRAMRYWRMGGLYSDDTQQAIVLAYLIGRAGEVVPAEVAEEYLRMAGVPIVGPYFGVFRGSGEGFRSSVVAYRKSKDWRQCGVVSAGNGAAMRIAPVAFFHRADPGQLFRSVVEVSLVTHRDPRGLAAAYAVAWLVANLAGQDAWPGVAILGTLAAATEAAEERIVKEYAEDLLVGAERAHDFSWALRRAEDTLRKKPRLILEEIVTAANERTNTRVTSPTDGFVLASVVASIVVALTQGGESYEAAVTRAVALGGDTDTVGAIVGALCGVFHGIEGVPERWQDGLQNSEGLVRYADALVDPLQRDLPEPIDAESRLCSQEEAKRQEVASKIR